MAGPGTFNGKPALIFVRVQDNRRLPLNSITPSPSMLADTFFIEARSLDGYRIYGVFVPVIKGDIEVGSVFRY